MSLDTRKARILTTMIDYYIETGEPLGSKALADMLGNCVSSATLRNDMAALTAEGYLEQPHTSAGRLPTPQAFRLYVERLPERRPLPRQEKLLVDQMLSGVSGDATRLLEETTRVLADLTGLAAVATRPEQAGAIISRLDVMQISPRNMAVVLVQDNGFLRTRMCRCRRDIPSRITVALADYMSRRFMGGPTTAITVAAMQDILLELGEAGLAVTPILSAIYELAQECINAKVSVAGQMNLLRHPDYELEQTRQLMGLLNDRQRLGGLLESLPEGGLQMLNGSDDLPQLKGSSLLVTRYSLGKQGSGLIGLIGPLRMDYAGAIPRMEYFADAVQRLLTELFEQSDSLDF